MIWDGLRPAWNVVVAVDGMQEGLEGHRGGDTSLFGFLTIGRNSCCGERV